MSIEKLNLIVGCGLSGAVMANKIANELGEKVVVIDKRNHIGGNIYDYKDKETQITVHKYGAHLFHTSDKEVWDFLSNFTKWHIFMHKVKAYIDGHEVNIPFNLDSLYKVFPNFQAQELEKELLQTFGFNQKIPILDLKQRDKENLKFLADYIYEKVFLNYTVKQWGQNPEEIDASVSARVPIFTGKDDRYFVGDTYQGIPEFGYTKMIEEMLKHPNIKVLLNTDFKNFEVDGFDRIFYTGAIDEFFDYCFGELPYRSLKFDILKKDCEYYQSNSVINYPNNYDFTRIIEHKYFLNEKSETSIITIEYPQMYTKNQNERYYPICNEESLSIYQKYIQKASEQRNLYFLGRLGDFKYYDMDKAVARALNVFKEIKGK